MAEQPERAGWEHRGSLLAPAAGTYSSYPLARSGDGSAAITISTVVNAVSRWWKVVLPASLLLALTAAGIVWLVFVPQYESTALLRIRDETPYIVFDDKHQSQKFVQTQVHLMTRRTILSDALKGIEGLPELARHKDPIDWVQKQLVVAPVGNSELFEVKYQGRTPHAAKAVVDAVVTTYLDYAARQDDLETGRVIQLLEQERNGRKRIVQRLREQVRDKSKELTGKDPFNPTGTTTVAIQSPLVALLNQRVAAEVELEVLLARLQAMEETPVDDLGPPQQLLDQVIQSDPEVVQLKTAIAETRARRDQFTAHTREAEQTATYKRYERQIASYEESLAKVVGELAEVRRNELLVQAEQLREDRLKEVRSNIERYRLTTQLLEKRFEEQVKEMEQSGGESLDLEFYRTELAREEKVFELISSRMLAMKTEMAAPGRVKLLDEANLPTEPVQWAPWKVLFLLALSGFCLPFGLAILWERTARRVGDAATLRKSDLHVLAEITALPVRSASGASFSSERSKRELSLFEESIDSLRTGLRLSPQLKDVQVLAVTSAISREGKTSLASQLAVSIARASGEKTLLIDADMRAPNLHQIFDIPNDVGLVDVLTKDRPLPEAISTKYSDLLHVIPAGELASSPHKLVGDGSFSQVIAQLRDNYRYIIIDTPPVLSAGEALVVSVAADATLLCAMRNYSRAEQVREAYDRLASADAKPIGVVLNGVPVHRYSYSYGRYGYSRYSYSRR